MGTLPFSYAHLQFNERREALKKASWGPEHKRDYHVMFVGTRPKAQNKGLASAMIRIGLERAKKDGREASLTTHSEERVSLAVLDLADPRPSST